MRLRCGSFTAGHEPHWIQVLRVAPDRPAHEVTMLDALGGTKLQVTVGAGRDREQHAVHNHAPADVLHAWAWRTGPARWTPGAALLTIEVGDAHPCFSVAAAPIAACPDVGDDGTSGGGPLAALVAEVAAELRHAPEDRRS
jgi:hypothetical protein